jgi:hypothetical protein
MRWIIRLLLFVAFACQCHLDVQAQTLHAVLVGDVSPSAGWGKYTGSVAMDLTQVSTSISENMPESRVHLIRLEIEEDQDSSPANLLDAVSRIEAKSGDAILFYFTGHGSADDQGHYLALAQGKLYRKDLLDALVRKNGKMVALITDCCNTRSDGYLYAAPYIHVERPRSPTPLFKKLFFETEGVVDINSSSPGQSSFFAPIKEGPPDSLGSIFTLEWVKWNSQEKSKPRSWDELVRSVGLMVHKSFHDYYPKGASIAKGAPIQTEQSIFPFTYPGMPPAEGPRSGIIVRDFPGRGSVIIEVTPGSPATGVFLIRQERFASLQPQQVVVAVNGKPTPDTESVVREIKASPQIMRMTVRDAKQGTFDALIRMKY